MLTDGHTHTQFCPHGSGQDAELMIQRAIKLGFKKYCITEHAPLPPDFEDDYAGTKEGLTEASMASSDLEKYFQEMTRLQKKYQSEIKITIGFEVDYLPGFEDWTKGFLDEYGPRTQENILSVHFMRGTDQKLWCVDFGVDDFQQGFKSLLERPQDVFTRYFQTVRNSVQADLGTYRPIRIGHMSLVRKYQDYFHLPSHYDEKNLLLIDEILQDVKQQNRQLDLNLAGLYKPFCNDFYPGQSILTRAQKLDIPLIYGSDAHDVLSVGRGYHLAKVLN